MTEWYAKVSKPMIIDEGKMSFTDKDIDYLLDNFYKDFSDKEKKRIRRSYKRDGSDLLGISSPFLANGETVS